MADLLNPDTSHERGTLRTLLLAALVLVAAAAVAFGIFYHHENHAAVEASALRSLTLPLHTVYKNLGKTVGGGEGSEDSTYVVAAIRVHDRSSVPLFLKDISANLVLANGTPAHATRIKAGDMDRLLDLVPTLRPILQKIGVPPIQPEQSIPANTSAEGYVLLQIDGPESLWTSRESASLTLDFYHQDSVTVTVPK